MMIVRIELRTVVSESRSRFCFCFFVFFFHLTQVFLGNTDRDTVAYHDLNPVIDARFVRVLPMEWERYISMRFELYGCK